MYINWEAQSPDIITSLDWYSADHIVEYLHAIRFHIIHANKEIPHLPSPSLSINKGKRFSKYASYLCEGIGAWHLKLDMINLLLYNTKADQSIHESQGNADVQILSLIHQLLQSIESTKDAITQRRFEARYGLIWIENDISNHDAMCCDNIICSYYRKIMLTASLFIQIIHKPYNYFFKQKYFL